MIVTTMLAAVVVIAVVAVGQLASMIGREQEQWRGDGLVPARVDRDTPVAQGAPLDRTVEVTAWASDTAARTGVPARALRAYAAAELAQRERTPECRLSWTTLAAIGRVESHHGRIGRSELDADGVARPPIIGVALDGSPGVAEILDTDGGALDGDPVHDRAVGPLQFLPATWERYGTDGNGDGVADPQQIDDAAAAAAAYLCDGGRDTASGDGWWDGVLTYNRSVEYARLVWAAADRYAGADTAS
jgi:membrane-bound lytic murein transglycosylase B